MSKADAEFKGSFERTPPSGSKAPSASVLIPKTDSSPNACAARGVVFAA